MSDPSRPLEADLIEEFRRRLAEARSALFRTLALTDEELATLEAHQAGAPVEDATTADAALLLSQLEGRERHQLDEIEAASIRLESGTFGLCERCGRAIGLARLRAMPAARYCVGCQAREEAR
jgi:DnaK suppressor protein